MLRYTPNVQKQVPYKGLFPQTCETRGSSMITVMWAAGWAAKDTGIWVDPATVSWLCMCYYARGKILVLLHMGAKIKPNEEVKHLSSALCGMGWGPCTVCVWQEAEDPLKSVE